jgi:hypothetical protein
LPCCHFAVHSFFSPKTAHKNKNTAVIALYINTFQRKPCKTSTFYTLFTQFTMIHSREKIVNQELYTGADFIFFSLRLAQDSRLTLRLTFNLSTLLLRTASRELAVITIYVNNFKTKKNKTMHVS